ncbi:MAG TPA: hypothetical protein VK002_04850 [Rubricoccaceae bacterium]|nr:hypothetical protein [Rubricoccaceae bacterium]
MTKQRRIELTVETEEALVIRRPGDGSLAALRGLLERAEAERIRLDDHEARIDRIEAFVAELAALRVPLARGAGADAPLRTDDPVPFK